MVITKPSLKGVVIEEFCTSDNPKKSTNFNSSNYTCFDCGKQGHIKVDCPNVINREKTFDKTQEKRGKVKKSIHCMARQ